MPKSYPTHLKPFIDVFKKLTTRHHAQQAWSDFILLSACAFSNAFDKINFEVREKRYLDTINRYQKEEQELFPELMAITVKALERNPEQDYLGELYMLLDLGSQGRGQVFTPYHVCQLMAALTVSNPVEGIHKQGYITLNDPACGAGATLIAGIHQCARSLADSEMNWQNHVLVTAQDIDEIAALMCYLQLSLLGAAGYVKVGDTLTEPMARGDSTENYWFTPMYFSPVWTLRKTMHMTSML